MNKLTTETRQPSPVLVFGRAQRWTGVGPVKPGDRVPVDSWRALTRSRRQTLLDGGFVEWLPEAPSTTRRGDK